MPIVNDHYEAPAGGWQNGTSPAINEDEMNAISDTLEQVPVQNGGTGANNVVQARKNLGLGESFDVVPVANGGTGKKTVVEFRELMGLGATLGALPIANGGTGQTGILSTTIDKTDGVIEFSKWGKVVMCTFSSKQKKTEFIYAQGTVPSGYRANNVISATGCAFRNVAQPASLNGAPTGICRLITGPAGAFRVEIGVPYGELAYDSGAIVTAVWLTN